MNRCVWIIDDHDAVAESILAFLLTEGMTGKAMRSYQEVHNLLFVSNEVPDVMILDIHMISNGNTLLGDILREPRLIFPVIMLTGYEDDVKKEYRGRVYKTIPKTVDPLELVMVVKRALGEIPT